MELTQNAKDYVKRSLGGEFFPFEKTDPDFVERFVNFAFDEVPNESFADGKKLDERTAHIAILAALLGCQGVDAFRFMLRSAINFGVSPIEIKEIVYQGTAYLGLGRTFPFLKATNEFLAEQDKTISLPLESQAKTNMASRLEAGIGAQVDIFGDGMKDFYKSGPEEKRHINRWLAANCFGDYYARGGLAIPEREMITFCFISAQGGCEPQLIAHARGNFNVGNDRLFLIKIVSRVLPFIGYPRSLNALSCIDKASESAKE